MRQNPKLVLALETSCDDTSVALVDESGSVLAVQSVNQDDIHRPYGGVIPELACRNHTMRLLPLIESIFKEAGKTWNDVDGICVTSKPGLIGSLMVGVTTAKTLAYVKGLPLLGVNHLEGHLHAPFLRLGTVSPPSNFGYPFVGLCVSGGHTSLYHVEDLGRYTLLGKTVDDAAGEAFDKFSKLMGLGYPGGAIVDKLAHGGDVGAYGFPRAFKQRGNLNFSFSGLKTAALLVIEKMDDKEFEREKSNLCASYQEAIVDVLVDKLAQAVEKVKTPNAVITGGVAANSRLRERMQAWANQKGICLVVPPPQFCTDNAAMIGYVGIKRMARDERSDLSLTASAFMKVAELV